MKSPTCATLPFTATFRTSVNLSTKSSSTSESPSGARCNRSFSSEEGRRKGKRRKAKGESACRKRFPFAFRLSPFAFFSMIAFQDNLPVIELANGQAIAFDRDWLVRSLSQAAQRAGY